MIKSLVSCNGKKASLTTPLSRKNKYELGAIEQEDMRLQKGINEDCDHAVDIVLIGNKNVGKSSFLFRFIEGTYSTPYFPTVGIDSVMTTIRTHDDELVQVKFWDTSGDIRSRDAIAKYVFPQASGFIVMYDVSDVQSYNDIYYWMRLCDRYALDNAKYVIVGNKQDLRRTKAKENQAQLTKEDGMEAAFCYQGKFMEVSSQTSRNIEKTVKRLVTNICEDLNTREKEKRPKKKVSFSPL